MAYSEWASPDVFLDARLFQRRTFVHSDMVTLVALDFILWIIWACVMRVSLVIGIFCKNLDDLAADMAGLRVPGHVIANFEFRGHDGVSLVIAALRASVARSLIFMLAESTLGRLRPALLPARSRRWQSADSRRIAVHPLPHR